MKLGDTNQHSIKLNESKALSYEISFHQFILYINDIKDINKIIVSQNKLRQVNASCSFAAKGSYCQEYNLEVMPLQQLNLTIKNCMEDVFIYVFPQNKSNSDATIPRTPQFTTYLSTLYDDKVCNGYFNSEQLMQCAKYKIEPCLMLSECYTTCGELDCFRGNESRPFFNIVVPKNITMDNAKNLCIFYNSIDQVSRCHGCQIYVDVYKFESSALTLEAYEEFILSIVIVFIAAVVVIISYYNLALAFTGKPPFRVCDKMPQLLFPRGAQGLGSHNIEEENDELKNLRGANKP